MTDVPTGTALARNFKYSQVRKCRYTFRIGGRISLLRLTKTRLLES
jgi:hypothetical protein